MTKPRPAFTHGSLQRKAVLTFIALLLVLCVMQPDDVIPQLQKHQGQLELCCKKEEDDPREQRKAIQTREKFCLEFSLGGFNFNSSGRAEAVTRNVTTCLIHSFSPYIERQAAERFLDPAHDNIYYANSPAIVWFQDEIVLVSRIWLDREIYNPQTWPANDFADNWLYMQRFNLFMKPTSPGEILGIPSPKQFWVGDGPIEPRIFKVQGRLFINFNSAMSFNLDSFFDFTVLWDVQKNKPIIPRIRGGSPMMNTTDTVPRDKHWMPLIANDELYFVYNLDPLRILKCTLDGDCYFEYEELTKERFVFDHSFSHLRGGTPFELWDWPYYIGLGHTTLYKVTNNHRHYTAHLIVLCVDPYRIVYVSNDLKIHPWIYQRMPIVRARYIDEGFIFPVGLIIETKDTIAIGVHVNDHSSVILRLKGMRAMMKNILYQDEINKPLRGPPAGFLQIHIHEVMANLTRTAFVHRNLHLERMKNL